MVIDNVFIELVGEVLTLARLDMEVLARDKPEQVALSAAVGTIALLHL